MEEEGKKGKAMVTSVFNVLKTLGPLLLSKIRVTTSKPSSRSGRERERERERDRRGWIYAGYRAFAERALDRRRRQELEDQLLASLQSQNSA